MKAPDAEKFLKAMQKGIEAHESKGHWVLVKRNELPRKTDRIILVPT